MKALFGFLAGLLLVAVMGAVLFLSGAIYDAADNIHTEPFIMQPNNRTDQRIGAPLALDDVTEKFVRERLIRKFIHEYFYVMPDLENIARRTLASSAISQMAAPNVLAQWRNNTASNIEEMAAKRMMRTVVVTDEILKQPNSDYWEVHYELHTWERPNDMSMRPIVENGMMYMKVSFTPGLRSGDIDAYLRGGGDPAILFRFIVEEIR